MDGWQMEYLWAPWRMEYIVEVEKGGCIFCQKQEEKDDEANFVLYRGKSNLIILNLFPYNPGHLLVAPYRHIPRLEDLTDEELAEHFNMVRKSVKLLTEVLKPTGFNIGLNIGKISGAGLEEHIHTHIVPRWQGDTSFMPVVSNTKVVPEALKATYQKLKEKVG